MVSSVGALVLLGFVPVVYVYINGGLENWTKFNHGLDSSKQKER